MFLWHEKTRGEEREKVRVCVISEGSEGVGELLSLPNGTVDT